MERALRFGLTLYVTNAEDYDPLLNTCIEYATQVGSHAGYLQNQKLTICGKEIDASPNFRLILAMNSAGAVRSLPPNLLSKCLLLNFAVTQSSYAKATQQKLLEYERPSVGKKRAELLADERRFSAKLLVLEKQLLETIGQTTAKEMLESDTVG